MSALRSHPRAEHLAEPALGSRGSLQFAVWFKGTFLLVGEVLHASDERIARK